MTDRFKDALSALLRMKKYSGHSHENTFKEMFLGHIDVIESALTLATESEQLRKRLAELENALAQATKKIQWYERTEATND